NGSTTLWGYHCVGGVLQHHDSIAHCNGQRTARTALADDGSDNRYLELGHGVQIMANGFGLPTLFGTDARVGARRIDEGKNGQLEFFGQAHQAQGFAIAFRTWHAEIAHGALFGVTAFLMTDDHARLPIETSHPSHDG